MFSYMTASKSEAMITRSKLSFSKHLVSIILDGGGSLGMLGLVALMGSYPTIDFGSSLMKMNINEFPCHFVSELVLSRLRPRVSNSP